MKALLLLLALSSSAFGQILAPILAGAPAGGGSNTWTLVQHVPSAANVCSGSTSCSLTITSTGSAHLLVLTMGTNAGPVNIKQTGMTGGGTWVHNGGDSAGNCADSSGDTDCAYVLSSTSGSTTVSWSVNASCFHCTAELWEYTPSTGTATFDTVGATAPSGFSPSPTGQGLTLTGTSDVIIQNLQTIDNKCTSMAISGSYTPFDQVDDVTPTTFASAGKVNTNSGTAPTWTCTNNTRYAVNAIAFK